MKEKVKSISSSVVRNLSSIEVPDKAFLYLAKGLNFVESKTADKEDIKYDTQEFLRKLEWRAYFHEKGLDDSTDKEISFEHDEHPDLRIPSRKHPLGYHNPLFDEIKTKLKGYVDTFTPTDPSANLTHFEKQGKAWVSKQIEDQILFVTKADKGGATLLLDFDKAVDCVKTELCKTENFTKSNLTVEEKMDEVKNTVQEKVLEAVKEGQITQKDKTIITGLNQNDNMLHSPVFKPAVPYVYPLFKIHKLSIEQIEAKTTPPIRLVHATKQGPLYRLEKWLSPFLTDLSRSYCDAEFLLDTPDLLSHIKELNADGRAQSLGSGIHLFTLDVISLYPSIKPENALTALKHALDRRPGNNEKKAVLLSFTKVVLKESFVTFQDSVYTGKKGIPTGNCISRQIADMTLHWLLILLILPTLNIQSSIIFWKRFIDDILGLWKGTKRQFDSFVNKLNEAAKPYGIHFGDCQFGKSVNYLDVQLSLDDNNLVQYRLFKKETDARLYLKTDSFHPQHVFRSVVFSQMIRVIQRNSKDSTCIEDLQELKQDFQKSGHSQGVLEDTEPKAAHRAIENEFYSEPETATDNKLVFSVKFFKEVDQLKRLVHSVRDDIKHLAGDVQITFALRKQPSIGNTVVRNRRLSDTPQLANILDGPCDQRCNGRGCLTCPQLFNSEERIMVNKQELQLDFSLTCKDKSIIYIAQCQTCHESPDDSTEDSYFGQTVTPFHVRMNGHRSKFKIKSSLVHEESALSMHCFLKHHSDFHMKHFKLGIVKRVRPIDLDREENKLINKFRTNIWGLNRMVVVR